MKKIDAHAHLGVFGGWAGDIRMDIETLTAQMDEYEIERVVLCGTGPENNDEVLEAVQKYPDRVIPLVFVNPLDNDCLDTAAYYIEEKGFRGIKLNPLKHAFVADCEPAKRVLELADKYKVPVFIHSGHPPYSLPWSIAFLAEEFPEVKVVMIHMGHGHGVYIDAAIKMARRFDNIYLEMSGMPMNSKIKEAYVTVGSDRVMFGTDAPFHHPTIEIQKVLTAELDQQGLENVFYNNALKVFEHK